MNIAEFITKWKKVELKERSAAQEHFLDLCRLMGHPTPAELDPTGDSFCFEKGASKHGGGEGFADVWKQGFFGWEYKGRHKGLDVAFDQLLLYKDALENPPLLVVCDTEQIVVHTNFTGTAPAVHMLSLASLGDPRSLEILAAVFFDPLRLKPGKTSEAITQDAAARFTGIADSMRARGLEAGQVAHFLDRIVFCLFAEDIGLLPDMIFSKIAEKAAGDPERFAKLIGQLFEAMATGGDFGMESIRHFNGSLFNDRTVPALTEEEVTRIHETVRLDWSAVEPSIFGTLFQRGLDPALRAQLGAHFTSRSDIEEVVENVVMMPLRREWDETREAVERLLAPVAGTAKPAAEKKSLAEATARMHRFLLRMQTVKVLDPACGSGNFLYVSLLKIKDLEKAAILFARDRGLGSFLPMVTPEQLYGIEVNPYAHDLAQMTVWIGWLQWVRFNGFGQPQDPILRPLSNNFRCVDAILDLSDPQHPREPAWPEVDFIVGNPPFLGDKMMRRELSDEYVTALRKLYAGRIPGQSDLCCYWFEKARAQIESGKCQRAGLLATQGIRGGANREVLKRIKETGDIFWAISDREWVLDGANVHVSIVAFDNGTERERFIDEVSVATINSNLTSLIDIVNSNMLIPNENVSFIGASMHGPFPINFELALKLLITPNPNLKPNSDLLRIWGNGLTISKRFETQWIIDVPTEMNEDETAYYQDIYEYLKNNVFPIRQINRRASRVSNWWLLGDPQKSMRKSLICLKRYIGTSRVSKHRLFCWLDTSVLPTDAIVVFARDDDYFFGVLHSRLHEVWALKLGTRLETRPRYTPTTCFETFPLPWPPGQEPQNDPRVAAIAAAAKELDLLRQNWLNPPEWTREEILEFPGTAGGPWDRYIDRATIQERGSFRVGTVRYPRTVAKDDACAARLAKRTLTNLYNERPTWLDLAHRRLDQAVFAAYDFPYPLADEEILERLLALNLARSGGEPG